MFSQDLVAIQGLRALPRPPNYLLLHPKYLLLRSIRALIKGHWGVLVVVVSVCGFGAVGPFGPGPELQFHAFPSRKKLAHRYMSISRTHPILYLEA